MQKRKSIHINEFFYIIFWCLMIFAKSIGLCEGTYAYNIIIIASAIFFCLKLISTNYTIFDIFWVSLIIILSIITYRLSGERGILFLAAILVGIKNCDVKMLMKAGAFIWGISFPLMALLTQSGLVNDLFLVHNKGSIGYIVRWSFGYTHPNVMHISFIILLSFIFYSANFNIKQLRIASIIGMLANLYVFAYSVSYTGFLLATVYLLLNYFFAAVKENPLANCLEKITNIILEMIFPFCVFFSVLGPILFKGRLYEICDKIVHHRFVLSNYFLTNEKLSLLGHEMSVVPDANRSLDCSYVYLLVHCGIIVFIGICLLYLLFIHNCVVNKRYKELSITLILLIAGVTEPFLFNTSFKNITFIFLGEYLFSKSGIFINKLRISASQNFACCSYRAILTKEISIHYLCDKEISTAIFSKLVDSFKIIVTNYLLVLKSFPKKIFSSSFIISMFITILFLFFTPQTKAVLIPTSFCPDGYVETPAYYSEDQVTKLKTDGFRILSYSSNEEMTVFYGNTALIEYLRILLSVFIWSFIFIIILFLTLTYKFKHPDFYLNLNKKGDSKC